MADQWLIIQGRLFGNALFPFFAVTVAPRLAVEQQPHWSRAWLPIDAGMIANGWSLCYYRVFKAALDELAAAVTGSRQTTPRATRRTRRPNCLHRSIAP